MSCFVTRQLLSCCFAYLSSAKSAVIFLDILHFFFFTLSQKDKHKTLVWEHFDRGIINSSKGVTDEAKCKNCAAEIKCTGGSTTGLLRHLKSKHSIEKPSSTQLDVIIAIHNLLVLQSVSRVLILSLHCTVS